VLTSQTLSMIAGSVSATLWGVIVGEGVAKGVRALTSFLDGMPAVLRESTVPFIIATRRTEVPTKNLREGVRVLAVLQGSLEEEARAELLSEPLLNLEKQNSPWVVATTGRMRGATGRMPSRHYLSAMAARRA
jgi:hypothetical protein